MVRPYEESAMQFVGQVWLGDNASTGAVGMVGDPGK